MTKNASKQARNPAETPPPKIPEFVTGEELGRILGVSSRRVRQLVAEKIIPPASAGGYPLAASIQALMMKAREGAAASPQAKAHARQAEAKATLAEQLVKTRNGELAPVDLVMAHVSTFTAEIVELLNGLPARVTRDLEWRAKIKNEVDAIRRQIADKIKRNVELARERCKA